MAESAASVSPILASSLGLNKIKTRSGPLPQESFFGFRGSDKGSALSNLSRPGVGSEGKKKKEAVGPTSSRMTDLLENCGDNGSNSDSMSPGSAQSREQSPNVMARSRLHNGESSEAGMPFFSFCLHIYLFGSYAFWYAQMYIVVNIGLPWFSVCILEMIKRAHLEKNES